MSDHKGVSRRAFLGGAVGGAAVAVGVGVADRGGVASADEQDTAASPEPQYLDFLGHHQTGITSPAPAAGLMASFDVVARDREQLTRAFRSLTDETRQMMGGAPYEDRDDAFPALYAGTLGNPPPPADLSVIVAVGASLFDDRFGLADRKPRELVQMPFLANDRLDPARSHGDVLLTLSADTPDVCVFALRQLMRRTRSELVLRWMTSGFNRSIQPQGPPQPGRAPARNLLGFRDGTANLDPSDPVLMDRHVWVGLRDDEPEWATAGSYQVARIIRMFVELWDRTSLSEQEAIIGRHKQTGAPLGGTAETESPEFASDPDGELTPLDAHIRLANPRTPETADSLILRRGFSYSRGFDGAGRLDQGLAFVSFQRSLEGGFLAVQNRLSGEPLEEYIMAEGGGFFFALPGVVDEDGYLGEGLLG